MVQKLSDYLSQAQFPIAEGTFLPTLNLVTYTILAQAGYWQRVGNVVHVQGVIQWTALDTADTSNVTVGGLPYTVRRAQTNSDATGAIPIVRAVGLDWGGVAGNSPTHIMLRPTWGQTNMVLYYNFSLGSSITPGESNPAVYGNLATAGRLAFGGSYYSNDPI